VAERPFERAAMKRVMRIYNETGDTVAEFSSIKRDGDRLVADGKALGVMRMDMIITVEEAFNGVRIALCWAVISFILLLPYFSVKRLLRRAHL
jgi:hypothetical protein